MTAQDQDEKLNALYRAEGWGKITDQVFLKVPPCDVTSAARTVARWTHGELRTIQHLLKIGRPDRAKERINAIIGEQI